MFRQTFFSILTAWFILSSHVLLFCYVSCCTVFGCLVLSACFALSFAALCFDVLLECLFCTTFSCTHVLPYVVLCFDGMHLTHVMQCASLYWYLALHSTAFWWPTLSPDCVLRSILLILFLPIAGQVARGAGYPVMPRHSSGWLHCLYRVEAVRRVAHRHPAKSHNPLPAYH